MMHPNSANSTIAHKYTSIPANPRLFRRTLEQKNETPQYASPNLSIRQYLFTIYTLVAQAQCKLHNSENRSVTCKTLRNDKLVVPSNDFIQFWMNSGFESQQLDAQTLNVIKNQAVKEWIHWDWWNVSVTPPIVRKH